MKTRFTLGTILLGLAVVTLGCSGGPTPAPKTTPVSSNSETAVTAKGTITPARYARVSFSTGGTVAQVKIKEGDAVKTGDVLAQLDSKDLEMQVKAGQDGLDLALASLAQAKTPASQEELDSAQAALDSALAGLDRARRGPTPEEFSILKANLAKAQAALDQAQAAYDRAGGATNPLAGVLPTSLQLQAATLDYQIARANYDKALKIDATGVAQAESSVAQAKAALELKQKGPRPEDIAVADKRVQQAQTALDQAKTALTKAKLVAPFDGTITALGLRTGELVQPGAPVATLADLSQLRVETTDLDEFGTARLKVGQAARISVNAYNDKTLTGKVQNIGYQSVTLPTGDISYVVTVGLDKQDTALRWGMTVKVEFVQEGK